MRYIQPTIHARTYDIVAVIFFTSDEIVELTITNNPDENFVLLDAVNEYLDGLEASVKGLAWGEFGICPYRKVGEERYEAIHGNHEEGDEQ
ncbi:hypothetical protein MEZE111188_00175 [Mesobacillus zeae]